MASWKDYAGGALAGAGTGAGIGSSFGLPGLAIGGGIGGLAGLLAPLFQKDEEYGQQGTLSPEQQQMMSQISGQMGQMGGQGGAYGQANQYLQDLLNRDPGVYDRFAAPYMQQFQQQILPQLGERFAGMGGGLGGGAGSSSGFAQALGGAGADLQSRLAGLFSNLQQGAAGQAMNQYNSLGQLGLGTKAIQPTYQPGSQGPLAGLISGGASGLAEGLGKYGPRMFGNNQANRATGTDFNTGFLQNKMAQAGVMDE